MKNPFRKKSSTGNIEKFKGVGTAQIIRINNIEELLEHIGPEDMVVFLKRYLSYVLKIIKSHSGVIIGYAADEVLTVWPPYHMDPNHAQLAFEASREILRTLRHLVDTEGKLPYDINIVIGSGEMVGDFLGPTKQFQVLGKGMAIVDHLSKVSSIKGSFVLMSQYTTDLLKDSRGLDEIELISRDNLDDLRVIAY